METSIKERYMTQISLSNVYFHLCVCHNKKNSFNNFDNFIDIIWIWNLI